MGGPRRRDERGAVALFAALVMATLVLAAAVGVDLGMQRVVRRDMQSAADTIAFDMARQLDGRTASAILASGTWATAKTQTVDRNAGTTLGADPTVDVELGTVDPSFTFSPATGATVPTAVRVTAASSVDFAFTSGAGGASRSAVAVARAQACYKLGSWGARLSTTSNANLLYRILSAHGVTGSVSAATYQSMADAHVDLTALSAALGFASPESLTTTSVSLRTLLNAVSTVVSSNGSSSAEIAALNAVTAGLGSLGGSTIALSKLVSVATGAGSGLSAAVNLADLVVGSLLLADGNGAVTVPSLTAALPGFAGLSGSVSLVQAATAACGFVGSTPNQSNQVSVTATGEVAPSPASLLAAVPAILGIAGVELVGTTQATLSLASAQATSTLDAVSCNVAAHSATIGTTGGLLSGTLTVPLSLKLSLTPLLSTTISGRVTVDLTPSATAGSVAITVPSQGYDTPYSNGGSQLQLPSMSATSVALTASGTLTDAKAKAVLDAVAGSILAPLVTSLNASLVGPLSDLLGLRTAGADVLLLDHPSCSSPALRG